MTAAHVASGLEQIQLAPGSALLSRFPGLSRDFSSCEDVGKGNCSRNLNEPNRSQARRQLASCRPQFRKERSYGREIQRNVRQHCHSSRTEHGGVRTLAGCSCGPSGSGSEALETGRVSGREQLRGEVAPYLEPHRRHNPADGHARTSRGVSNSNRKKNLATHSNTLPQP
jgi:hypothetical protein